MPVRSMAIFPALKRSPSESPPIWAVVGIT